MIFSLFCDCIKVNKIVVSVDASLKQSQGEMNANKYLITLPLKPPSPSPLKSLQTTFSEGFLRAELFQL